MTPEEYETWCSRPEIKRLGVRQRTLLDALRRGTSNPLWDTPAESTAILESLVRRGLAVRDGRGYKPAE